MSELPKVREPSPIHSRMILNKACIICESLWKCKSCEDKSNWREEVQKWQR